MWRPRRADRSPTSELSGWSTCGIGRKTDPSDGGAGVHAILVWDGAGYHTGDGLVVPSNVSLIQLVPYSPELNPVENLWHYLRSHYWSLRVYRDYDALEEAAMAAWRAVCLEPGSVRSICAAPYVTDHA